MTDMVWLALANVVQPAGLLEIATVVAVVVVATLCARLATSVVVAAGRVPVRVRAERRPAPRSRSWDADAPGRPQPRAPGDGRHCG